MKRVTPVHGGGSHCSRLPTRRSAAFDVALNGGCLANAAQASPVVSAESQEGGGGGFLRGMEWVHKPYRSACVLEPVPKLDLVLRNEAPFSIF